MTTQAGSNADNLELVLSGDNVPEKFRGKSVKDVFGSYDNLQQAYSRQGQEVGELRKLATTLSEHVAPASKVEPAKPVTPEDLLADPDKTINDVINAHPTVKHARDTADQLERQLAVVNLEQKHPNFRDTATDEGFRTWVQNNKALSRLAQQADNYDFDSADTLFSLWQERKDSEKKVTEASKRREKEKAGTLEGSSGADASSEEILSRAEMRDLQTRANLGDRKAKAIWESREFQEKRRRAYLDKRVS